LRSTALYSPAALRANSISPSTPMICPSTSRIDILAKISMAGLARRSIVILPTLKLGKGVEASNILRRI
jgi:hypothetical protein